MGSGPACLQFGPAPNKATKSFIVRRNVNLSFVYSQKHKEDFNDPERSTRNKSLNIFMFQVLAAGPAADLDQLGYTFS